MSIKYDLLDKQIHELERLITEIAGESDNRNRVKRLWGALNLLEYIRDEKDSANLNVWENESDDAANVVDDYSATKVFYAQESDADGFICFRWGWTDVQDRASENDIELTKEQSMDILMEASRRHDANIGISWDVLDVYINMEIDKG